MHLLHNTAVLSLLAIVGFDLTAALSSKEDHRLEARIDIGWPANAGEGWMCIHRGEKMNNVPICRMAKQACSATGTWGDLDDGTGWAVRVLSKL